MASTARTVRSNAAAASRRPEPAARPASRPELRVVNGGRADKDGLAAGFGRVMEWVRTRSAPTVHIVIAVAFLASTLVGALMLRTQMVSNAFEVSSLETSISRLTQDVQDDQAKLDQLQASLPQKASDMGMVPQSSSVSIDLNGYRQTTEGGQQ
ncbi:hypothetical protein [Bifidobacterium platyrrhinorum]|uniref:Cell division protein FtsL n=1 Tax=Bifidobacterium platyrrhinorum TaxID=2661628 RepID=A0A6L9SPC4_9BIFI|nr:hypothetical protein [Bifidobacterium platyrrhinorum]NEG54378.1 hypothetical protein [Bifidobacterium platyrrhinorum]